MSQFPLDPEWFIVGLIGLANFIMGLIGVTEIYRNPLKEWSSVGGVRLPKINSV